MKRRFDDTEYLEQSRDIVDNVKSAVATGNYHCFLAFFHSRLIFCLFRYAEEEEESKDNDR